MTDNFDAIKDFLTPKEIIVEEIDTNHSKIVLEPLERGFGHTLGNALRRIILSSTPGSAVVEAKIDGVLEKQFRNYYKQAARKKGETGTNLLVSLESRLDNLVYRMGFAATRAEARQLVNHKTILVNGTNVNIPSYQVTEGDSISVSIKGKKQKWIMQAIDLFANRETCDWISLHIKEFTENYDSFPTRDLLSTEINENYIVELYSR